MITLPSQACGCEQVSSEEVGGTRLRYHRKLVAVSTLPAGTRIPSQACGCEQLTSEEVWGHDYHTMACLWHLAPCQRRGSGTRLRYHRKFVAVSNLPVTRFGDTITLPWQVIVTVSSIPAKRFGDTIPLPSQACGCEQLTTDEVWGHDYVTIASLCWFTCSEEAWGHDDVTIASLWL